MQFEKVFEKTNPITGLWREIQQFWLFSQLRVTPTRSESEKSFETPAIWSDYVKFGQKKVASFGRFVYNRRYQRLSLEGL
jgi:hypothetical protein